MPLYHKPKTFTPLLIAAEEKAVKNGLHHSIFTSRFDKYKGEWKNDLKEGGGFPSYVFRVDQYFVQIFLICTPDAGIYNDTDKDVRLLLKRPWIQINYYGKGTFLTITGKLYEGDWHKGFRHGFGTLSKRQFNGTFSLEYRGEWVRGKPEGAGWQYYDNGDVYFGFWTRGQRHGYGKMWYNDDTFYVGYWCMSKKQGLGMFVQENGNRYEGHWEGDQKNGVGRFYHLHTGQLQEGCWKDDVCVKSKMSDIIIRQFCELPTEYPIPPETLRDSRKILEQSEFWLRQKIGDIDKRLQFCIDQMY